MRLGFCCAMALVCACSSKGGPPATDAAVDSRADGATDASVDSAVDADDAASDSGLDADLDAAGDGGADATMDAGTDAGDVCDAFDARPEGFCRLILGVTWNGASCEIMSGCSCIGTDCSRLYDTVETCNGVHGSCTGDCASMDARGVGACAAFFGYAWNGTACVGLSGCSCEGTECGSTYESPDACAAAYSSCIGGTTCGGFIGALCERSEYCDYPSGCGFADGTGTCRVRPEICTADCPGVCGCDGRTHCNSCNAASSGVDVLHAGPCEEPPPPPVE